MIQKDWEGYRIFSTLGGQEKPFWIFLEIERLVERPTIFELKPKKWKLSLVKFFGVCFYLTWSLTQKRIVIICSLFSNVLYVQNMSIRKWRQILEILKKDLRTNINSWNQFWNVNLDLSDCTLLSILQSTFAYVFVLKLLKKLSRNVQIFSKCRSWKGR